jgi:3-hydroxybutyryl-CoA dehydratase
MKEYKEKSFSEIKVGDSEWLRRTVTDGDIANFAGVSGDFNVLHTDELYASKSMFKGRIAHGFFTATFITNLVGNKLPGPGGVYLKQDLRFLAPVRVGDTITAEVEVIEKIEEKQRLRLKTTCTNQDDKVVMDGEALVMVLKK